MKTEPHPGLPAFLRFYVNVAILIIVMGTLLILSGWLLGLPRLTSLFTAYPPMRFNTALSLLLMAGSLWLLKEAEAAPSQKRLGNGLAGLALLLSLLTFFEYLLGRNLGIDELFVKDLYSAPNLFPGRIAPLAAICIFLGSISLLRLGSRLSRYLSYIIISLSSLVILNNIFGFQLLLHRSETTFVPMPTGMAFLFLSTALVSAQPTYALVRMFSSNLPGSLVMRYLFPLTIILYIALAWLVEEAEALGMLDPNKESVFLVLLLFFTYLPLIYFIAKNINQVGAKLALSDQILERVNALVLVADAQGSITYASPSVKTILGFEPSELLGEGWWQVSRPDPAEGATEKEHIVSSVGQSPPYERAIQDRWGNTHWIMWMDAPGPDSSIIGVGHDITERKRTEQALQESEQRFSKAFYESPVGIVLTDLTDTVIRDVNDTLLEMLNLTREQVVGQKVSSLNIQVDPHVREEINRELMEKGKFRNQEVELRLPSGKVLYMLDSGSVITVNGRPHNLGLLLDITERKRAEQQLTENEIRYRQAIAAANAIPYSLDYATNQYTFIGEGIAELTGFPPVEFTPALLEGLIVESIMQGGFKGMATREAIDLVRQGKTQMLWHCDHHIRTRSGEQRWLSDASIQVWGENGIPTASVGIFQDITDRKSAEAALLQSEKESRDLSEALEQRVVERTADLHRVNTELERAARAKDEFMAVMSHELRTPLNSILGMSEILLDQVRGPLNDRQQQALRVVEASGQHLLALINDILDLSKIEAGKLELHPERLEILSVCQASLVFVKEQAFKKTIILEFQPALVKGTVMADPRALKQILVNLLSNAVKFTPANGHVLLEVSTDTERHLLQFIVTDTGIGISHENLGRLFQPFVQVDSRLNRQFEGTGLGLALVQRLADLHGGSVQVESEVGRGSRFTVNLPWQPETSVTEDVDELSSREPVEIIEAVLKSAVQRGLVLLVEDNPANVLTIAEYLESKNFQVAIAHNGLEAIARAFEVSPSIILMDIQMPMLDGLEATRRLRAESRFQSVPIIALTALAMPGDRERCLQAGASEYLSKPVSLKQLVQMIDGFIGQNI